MKVPMDKEAKETIRKLKEWSAGFEQLETPAIHAFNIAELIPDMLKALDAIDFEYARLKSWGEAAIEMNKKAKREERFQRQTNYNKFHRN